MKKIIKALFTIFVAFSFVIGAKAADASISVSSTGQVVVGNTFTVKIKISSSKALGSWEFTPTYDSKIFKFVSGESPVVGDYNGNKNIKSKTYTYKFKAIGTGTGKIGVKSYGAYSLDEKKLSVSAGTKSVKVITQAQLEATYSKNNYLKSLSVDGLKLSPAFKKDTLEYRVEANSNTTSVNIKASVADSKSSVSGRGKHNVAEGENVFKIVVKAQNGSTRTYKVIVNVIDPNPITVNIDGKDLTVVKRESALTAPEDFEKTTIKINDIDVPAFFNETNNYTLVGLKDSEETKLYIYDAENNTYSEYFDVKLDELDLYPLEIDRDFGKDYTKSSIVIGNHTFSSLKLAYANYHILKARNLNTGKDNYYLYDEETNTAIRYAEEKKDDVKTPIVTQDTKNDLKDIVIILASACGLMMFITLFALIASSKSKKKLKKLLNMIEEKTKQAEEKKKEKELKSVEKVVEDENKDVKPLENVDDKDIKTKKATKKKQTKNKAK